MSRPSPFPRKPDGLPHAWGPTEAAPSEVWERFSPAYEAQAEIMWHAFVRLGLAPALEWAGSQDGEAIIGRDEAGQMVVLYHLEDPQDAQAIQRAIATDTLPELIADSLRAIRAEAVYYAALEARRGEAPPK